MKNKRNSSFCPFAPPPFVVETKLDEPVVAKTLVGVVAVKGTAETLMLDVVAVPTLEAVLKLVIPPTAAVVMVAPTESVVVLFELVEDEKVGDKVVEKAVGNGDKLVTFCVVIEDVVDVTTGEIDEVKTLEIVVECVVTCVAACVVACVGDCVVPVKALLNDTLNGLFDVSPKSATDKGLLQYSEKQAQTCLKISNFNVVK